MNGWFAWRQGCIRVRYRQAMGGMNDVMGHWMWRGNVYNSMVITLETKVRSRAGNDMQTCISISLPDLRSLFSSTVVNTKPYP